MKHLMIIILVSFSCSLSMAKLVKGRKAQIQAMYEQCMSTGAYGKMLSICDCITKDVHTKMSKKQIEHIYLARNGERNKSKLPVDEGSIVEEFEAIGSATCKREVLKVEEEK